MELEKAVGLGASSRRDNHLMSGLPELFHDGREKEHVGRIIDVDPDAFSGLLFSLPSFKADKSSLRA